MHGHIPLESLAKCQPVMDQTRFHVIHDASHPWIRYPRHNCRSASQTLQAESRPRILVIFALHLLLLVGYSMICPCWFRARTDMASGGVLRIFVVRSILEVFWSYLVHLHADPLAFSEFSSLSLNSPGTLTFVHFYAAVVKICQVFCLKGCRMSL